MRALAEIGPAAREVLAGTRMACGVGTADAIVVLGARVLPGGVPSGSLRARSLSAAALYHAGGAPIVVTTGATHGQPPGEAVVARALLLEAGVPAAAIRIEEKSRNTRGNMAFARGLVDGDRVWLVTEPFHMGRALRLARDVGFDPLPWPVDSPAWRRPLDRWRLLARDTLSLAFVRAGA
jgi:uncharacterized SAM-binding protein YcdF (DUF218 family)